MRTRLAISLLAGFAVVAVASMAFAASSLVKTRDDSKLGTILVSSSGRTLYHLTGETTHHFMCLPSNANCPRVWPPLTTPKPLPKHHLSGLTTVRRPDSHKLQLAYKGHPLYRFSGDNKAGDTNGQGFAGIWFAVKGPKPKTQTSTQTTPAPSPGYPTY